MKHLLPAAALGCALSAAPAHAQDCSQAASNLLPAGSGAIAQWERDSGIQLTRDAKTVLLSELCNAGAGLVNDGYASIAEVNSAAPSALHDYLNQSMSSAREINSLSYTLGARFVLNSGPAIPGPRALGRIKITYNRTVDALVVAGTRVAPLREFMSAIGTVRITGYRAATPICNGQVSVIASAVASFVC